MNQSGFLVVYRYRLPLLPIPEGHKNHRNCPYVRVMRVCTRTMFTSIYF